ncbi:acyltransferase [Mucilaginibacter yixingensis]|nr:acyltransferase [Mucilaginibacter yixingensis]
MLHNITQSGYYRLAVADALDRQHKAQFSHLGGNSILPAQLTLIGPQYTFIGDNFKADDRLRLEAWDNYAGQVFTPQLKIGNNVSLGTDVHIGCINQITIGSGVLMGSRIYITDHSHGDTTTEALKLPPVQRRLVSKGPVIIEDNVWIGDGVCIMPNVHVGTNAIIGANAVVTKDVPANTVVAGVPACIIKTLV